MAKELLLPPNKPFEVTRTEKPEGSQYPTEGLVDDIYLHMKPSLGKTAYADKKSFDKSSYSWEILVGYFSNGKLFFIPKNPVDLHGDMFCFNRPKEEDDEKSEKAQQDLLKKWAKHCCVTVLECEEHSYLNKLAKEFDGFYLPEQDFTLITEPKKFEDLPKIEQDKFAELVPRLKSGEDDMDIADEDDLSESLMQRGLLVKLAQEQPEVRKAKYNKALGNDIINDVLPEYDNIISLKEYADKFQPPKQQSGGQRKGGGYITPQNRLDFVNAQLEKAGIESKDPYSTILDCYGDHLKQLALNYVLTIAGCYPPNWNVPDFKEGLANEAKETKEEKVEEEVTEEKPKNKEETKNGEKKPIDQLKEWIEENQDELYAQGFDKVQKGEIVPSDEWIKSWFDLVKMGLDVQDTKVKEKAKEVTEKPITRKNNHWLGLTPQELDKFYYSLYGKKLPF